MTKNEIKIIKIYRTLDKRGKSAVKFSLKLQRKLTQKTFLEKTIKEEINKIIPKLVVRTGMSQEELIAYIWRKVMNEKNT